MTIDDKLKQLRQEWKDNPARRDIIEVQARALMIARDKKKGGTEITAKMAREILLN